MFAIFKFTNELQNRDIQEFASLVVISINNKQ